MSGNLQPQFCKDLALHRWRGELSPQISHSAIRWAFCVTRFSTDPAEAAGLLAKHVGDIPEADRPIFVGARSRLLHHMGALPTT